MRKWVAAPFPPNTANYGTLTSAGGEDTASAPGQSPRPQRLENVVPVGQGYYEQVADWRSTATCENGSATENNAVCGIFAFATQGGASAPSAGVAFSFNVVDQAIYLHQLGEDGSILRTLTAYSGYTQAQPPQMTGVEMFGKFYFCEDGREAAADRLGMGVFDPTSTGTITIPTYDLGGGANPLQFKGIAKFGGLLCGWGYESKTTPDAPHLLTYCKYTDPTTWVPDTTSTSAGQVVVGTLNLPIVACATSGPYLILGKATEVFRLTGDYSANLGYTQIGTIGPVSTTGIVSNGDSAYWVAGRGPMVSTSGGLVTSLGVDRLTRRWATFFDLTRTVLCHDPDRTRIGMLLRRQTDLAGTPQTAAWPDWILWYDYIRDAFYNHQAPTTCAAFGVISGPSVATGGPIGTPQSLTTTGITNTSAVLSWVHTGGGDPTAFISIEYKLSSASTWTVVGPAAPGTVTYTITGLIRVTAYDWRLRYFKNGQYGSYTSTQSFTTTSTGIVNDPTNFRWRVSSSSTVGGKTYITITFSWVTDASAGSWALFENTANDAATAARVSSGAASATSTSLTKLLSTTPYYYWIQATSPDGGITSHQVLVTPIPVTYNEA